MRRLQMQVSGVTRPLTFSGDGHSAPLLDPIYAAWPGVTFEVHRTGNWEGEAELGPLRGDHGLLVYLSGSVKFSAQTRRGDRSWVSQAGDVTLISGDDCTRLFRSDGSAEVACVDLPRNWVRDHAGVSAALLGGTVRLGQQQRIAHTVESLRARAAGLLAADPLIVEVLSHELLDLALDAAPSARVSRRGFSTEENRSKLTPAACRTLREYIHSHLEQRISLGELASLVGCRPRTFSTIFKAAFGVSPYQYVLSMRLVEGAGLLRHSSCDISEVAYRTGFSSHSHFCTAFGRAFGCRPGDYARRYRCRHASLPGLEVGG